jgi:hypothetical protein
MRNTSKILVRKPESKKSLGKSRSTLEDNIKIDLSCSEILVPTYKSTGVTTQETNIEICNSVLKRKEKQTSPHQAF